MSGFMSKITKTNQMAISALRAQIQRIAFDANLYDTKLCDNEYAERCSKKRKELQAAIDMLSGKITYQPELMR